MYDGSNNLLMRFEYADGRLPVSVMTSSGRQFLFYDQVGSLKAVANSAGSIVKQIEYDSFGNILSDSNPSLAVPFGFAGGLHDRDTGLVRFGFRDYDPVIGRWTAKDPVRFASGTHDLFGYVHSDPINFIDPLGLIDIPWYVPNSAVVSAARDRADYLGYDTSQVSDQQVLDMIKALPQEDADRINEMWDKLPDEGTKMTDKQRKEAQEVIKELRKMIETVRRNYCNSMGAGAGAGACPKLKRKK